MVSKKRSQAQSISDEINPSSTFRQTAIALAVAAALPGAAFAQSSGDDEVIEEIVTVGIRTSILNSVDAKRMADSIADVVDAGALGSLPDQSIADALGRVPGVTTVRDSGQSSQLNIRGMNGDFIQTTLNGREQASTAGYVTHTRWMSFDQFPAEMINQAAVFKSPKASQLEGGVAGIVELKTVDPLEAPKEHNFVLNGRLSYNDAADEFGGDEDGYRISATYQGKFADDTFGIAAGYSYLDQPNAYVWSRAGADDGDTIGYSSLDASGDGNAESVPRAFQWLAGTGTDERTGYLASLVWEPNDKIRAQVDYFRSEFDRTDGQKGITVSGLVGNNAANSSFSNVTVTNGVATSGTVSPSNTNISACPDGCPNGERNHPWFESRTGDQSTVAETDTYGITLEWYPTDTSTLVFDAYTSEGDKHRRDRIASLHAYEFDTLGPGTFQELQGQALSYQINGQGIVTGNFSGVDFTDPTAMRLGRYEEYPHHYTDEIDAFKVDFRHDLEWGWISGIEAGVRISDRKFVSDRGTWQYGAREGLYNTDGVPIIDPPRTGEESPPDWCEANNTTVGGNPIACEPQSVDGFVQVQSLPGVPDHFVVTDLDGLASSIFGAGNYGGIDVYSDVWTFLNDTTVKEETDAIYLMANLDFTLGDIPVRGNIGVRYVETDVKASGLQDVGAGNGVSITDGLGVTQDNLAAVDRGPDYSDTLPSLNLAFELTENDILRFAAASVMGRPPVGRMTGSAGSWSGSDTPQGTAYNVWTDGSPYLDPFRADQLDLSYEHYFEGNGAVTAAVFWKDIDSLVEGPTQFTGVDPDSVGVILPPGSFLDIYQTYFNNDLGGYIRGIELAATGTFDNLPSAWSGLGATASYSYTESETEVGGGSFYGQNLPLPGLSENVWSATIFFDYEGFSAHVNTRYRDKFIVNLPIPGNVTPVWSDDYTTVDAQVSYNWPDLGLSVVLSGNNLTDEENIIEYGVPGFAGEYKTFGRQYYLGVNYQY